MNETPFNLPGGQGSVKLAYMGTWSEGSAPIYLHWKKRGLASPDPKRWHYLLFREKFVERFCNWAQTKSPDAIVAVPSTDKEVEPYRVGFSRVCPSARDLSGFFTKAEGYKAMTDKGGFEEAKRKITATDLDAQEITSVIILDDIVATGKTAATVLCHLRSAGLPLDAEVWLATPLWVDTTRLM